MISAGINEDEIGDDIRRRRRRRVTDNDDEDQVVDTMSQVETNYVKFPDIPYPQLPANGVTDYCYYNKTPGQVMKF